MDIKIGDTVRFLNAVGGGKVSGFQKGNVVLVEDEDGFEMPVLASEVVVVETQTSRQATAAAAATSATPTARPRKEKPEEPTEEDIRIAQLREEYAKTHTTAAVTTAPRPQTTPTTADDTDETLEQRVARLEMQVRRLQMRLERLEDARALREKTKADDLQRREHKHRSDEPIEVDLHAHELLDTTAGMGAREIKEYQLKVVEDTMRQYASDYGRKIVFIHGNGEGVLRKAVYDLLHRKFPKCDLQDASFRQYGFGATMVTIH